MKSFCDFCGKVIRRRRKQLEDHLHHFCNSNCQSLWKAHVRKFNDPNRRKRIQHCLKSIYGDIEKPKNETRKKYVNFKKGGHL